MGFEISGSCRTSEDRIQLKLSERIILRIENDVKTAKTKYAIDNEIAAGIKKLFEADVKPKTISKGIATNIASEEPLRIIQNAKRKKRMVDPGRMEIQTQSSKTRNIASE